MYINLKNKIPLIWLPNKSISIVSSIMLWHKPKNDKDKKTSFLLISFFLASSIKKPPPKEMPKVNPMRIILATLSDMPKKLKGIFKIFNMNCQIPNVLRILINAIMKKIIANIMIKF